MAVSIARDLDLLEQSMGALKLDYERFFSGDVKVPPVPARKNVEQALRRLGNAPVEKVAERFRLHAIQSRFTILATLWEKRVLAREEGRSAARIAIRTRFAEAPAQQAFSPSAGDTAPAASVKGSGRTDLKSLFDRYCAARTAAGEDATRLRYERFEELVKMQAAEIRKATGATRLAFDVQTRDGKVRLVGRSLAVPAKGPS